MILNVKFLTIRFTHGGRGNWKHLKENLDEFLQEYEPGYWVIWLFKERQYVASFHDFYRPMLEHHKQNVPGQAHL